MPRIFHRSPLQGLHSLCLDESAARHVGTVLRLRPGEDLVLFDGLGGEYPARLTRITRRQVEAELGSWRDIERESPLKITLGQVVARGERMDYVMQKSTELGVTDIVPLLSQRCGVDLDPQRWEKRLHHWRGVVQGACEQCGRNRLPEITPVRPLREWLGQAGAGHRYLLHPEAGQPLEQGPPPEDGHLTILVGPEGGWTPQEVNEALSTGFRPLRLGPRILRAETAGPALLAIAQARWGDLSEKGA